jgi:hypothetical protein
LREVVPVLDPKAERFQPGHGRDLDEDLRFWVCEELFEYPQVLAVEVFVRTLVLEEDDAPDMVENLDSITQA